MSIQHKFYRTDFGNGFETHNTILDVTPYEPKIMFIGTCNPDTPKANFADFFYGRNYFWPALANLFLYNHVKLSKTRMPKKGKPTGLDPTYNEIFDLLKRLEITFSDLIGNTLKNANFKYKLLDNVIFNGNTYNLILDQKSKGIHGLTELDKLDEIEWNTDKIIEYLNSKPSIKRIYLTRQPTGIWAGHWDKIKRDTALLGREFNSIYTPSAQGGALHQQTNIYKKGKMKPLLSHWITNKDGCLDRNWLIENNVNLEHF